MWGFALPMYTITYTKSFYSRNLHVGLCPPHAFIFCNIFFFNKYNIIEVEYKCEFIFVLPCGALPSPCITITYTKSLYNIKSTCGALPSPCLYVWPERVHLAWHRYEYFAWRASEYFQVCWYMTVLSIITVFCEVKAKCGAGSTRCTSTLMLGCELYTTKPMNTMKYLFEIWSMLHIYTIYTEKCIHCKQNPVLLLILIHSIP